MVFNIWLLFTRYILVFDIVIYIKLIYLYTVIWLKIKDLFDKLDFLFQNISTEGKILKIKF